MTEGHWEVSAFKGPWKLLEASALSFQDWSLHIDHLDISLWGCTYTQSKK